MIVARPVGFCRRAEASGIGRLFRVCPAESGSRALTTKISREHAAAIEEAASVLPKEERLLLLPLLKKLGKGPEAAS
jgi:hypothetical protein